MAAASGTENPDVVVLAIPDTALEKVRDQLFAEPYTYDFFQAVRILGWLRPDKSPVGRHSHPQSEVVRFGANPILHFPASSIQDLSLRRRGMDDPVWISEELAEGRLPRTEPTLKMTVNFMGLVGPLGALPNYVTELIAARIRVKDHTLLGFINIFNHRLVSFFFRAWEKNHFTVTYERDRSDPLSACLYSLIGFGTKGLRDRQKDQGVEDETFIYYSGLFSLMPKSPLALESVLGDYFDIPVEIEPFIGAWRSLAIPDQCELAGEVLESTMLGMGAVVGDEIWDQGSRVRIKLGPLSLAQYNDFLPTGKAWPALRAIVRSFCGFDLEFEVQLILRREDVPACELRAEPQERWRLGWHTWLKSGNDFDRDPGDTKLLIREA